jgi:hypothetical protein
MKTRKSPRNRLEITILKRGIRSKKVISCCFFTMADAYRDFEKYKRYFMKFLYQKRVLKGFETRVYTDDSGKDFILKVTKHDPMVTVYRYNYAPLREKIGHVGTLGTMMRFLPLFEPGLEVVWISDIDIPDSYLNPSYLTRSDDFIFRSFPAYKIGLYNRPYTIIANTIISYITFSNELFYTYLHNLTYPEGKLKQYIEDQNKDNQDRTRAKPYSKIPYGIDEYFMNTIMYDHIVQSLFKTCVILDYKQVFVYLRQLKLITDDEDAIYYTYSLQPNSNLFEKLKKIYTEKAPLIEDKYPGIISSFTDSFIKIYRKKGTELLSP